MQLIRMPLPQDRVMRQVLSFVALPIHDHDLTKQNPNSKINFFHFQIYSAIINHSLIWKTLI